MRLSAVAAAAILMLGPAAAVAQSGPAPAYRLSRSVPLGSPERWDYVVFDQPSGRVYVAHGDRVSVVDGRTGARLGEIAGMPGGSHGIGVSTATGKGYTDDGEAGQAVAFDLKTLRPLGRIKAQDDADGIVLDPATGHMFVINGESASLTVIDPKTDAVVATIAAGGGLEYAVADGAGAIYVNGAQNKEIVRIDTRTNAVDARWPMPQCTGAHGLAMDVAAHRLFISCANKQLIVMDSQTGKVVTTVAIGQGSDAVVFDPKRKLVLSSNGEGTVSVIKQVDPDTYASLAALHTGVTARTMAIDPDSGRLYIAAADIDPKAPIKPTADGRPGRPQPLPGSLKLLFFDPALD